MFPGKYQAVHAAALTVVLLALAASGCRRSSSAIRAASTPPPSLTAGFTRPTTAPISLPSFTERGLGSPLLRRSGKVADQSVRELAERSLALYGEPGGLSGFQLETPLLPVEVGGLQGLACAYTYQDERGNLLWEYRIFLLLPDGEGFSIALGSNGPWVKNNPPVLEEVLKKWQWTD